MEQLGYTPPEEVSKFETETKETQELHTPFYKVTLDAFKKEFPEKKREMEIVLNEIDRQGIENFASYKSKNMPGVSFSYTKLEITPELISKISGESAAAENISNKIDGVDEHENDGEKNLGAKKQDYFLFAGATFPPDGHAFTPEDMAIDRFIRLMPRVARPMKEGEEMPEVNIYMLGAPTGFGGSVTEEWISDVNKSGLETNAKLYAEFIKEHEPENNGSRHIVLQGLSKGAIVAEKTTKYLPEDLQKNTQRLLDNPAGDHKPSQFIKGAEVAVGIGAEMAVRALFDNEMMKPLMKAGGPFIDRLSEKTGIAKDDKKQARMKLKSAVIESWNLVKGSPLDTEATRSFIRQGIADPLSFSPKRLFDIWQKQNEGISMPMFAKGKSLEVPFKGSHLLFYNRYSRWNKVLDYIGNTK
jgi:hypothetical protein